MEKLEPWRCLMVSARAFNSVWLQTQALSCLPSPEKGIWVVLTLLNGALGVMECLLWWVTAL